MVDDADGTDRQESIDELKRQIAQLVSEALSEQSREGDWSRVSEHIVRESENGLETVKEAFAATLINQLRTERTEFRTMLSGERENLKASIDERLARLDGGGPPPSPEDDQIEQPGSGAGNSFRSKLQGGDAEQSYGGAPFDGNKRPNEDQDLSDQPTQSVSWGNQNWLMFVGAIVISFFAGVIGMWFFGNQTDPAPDPALEARLESICSTFFPDDAEDTEPVEDADGGEASDDGEGSEAADDGSAEPVGSLEETAILEDAEPEVRPDPLFSAVQRACRTAVETRDR